MIKLALIDNGIPYHMRNNRNQRIVHKSFLASKCDPSEYKDDKSFHGAVCVGIITSICSDIELWDLNVTDSAGTTQITVLLEALEWCIQNKIKLIHMSLGTINYFDIKPLWIQIKRLLDADAIIVAAYHNRNIKTYPAAYPGVFGVRQDRYGLLGNGQILFQEQKGYNIENSIIANFSWNGIVNQANSYAAPVVTGHIATYLNRKPTAGFDDVMDFLMTIATHKSDYPDILENVIRDKTNIEIPVIAGIDLDYEEMIQLKVMFSQNGYYAINLQKNPLDENVIPLEYYDDSNESLNDILYTVYIAYEPDIILLNQEEEIFESSKASDIDMYIVRKNNMYELYAEDRIGITYNIETIQDEVMISMKEENEKEADKFLEMLDLIKVKDRHPMSLSGGQKQRVAIASAIASGRSVLFLDEPTSGLDHKHMLEVAEVLREVWDTGISVYVITHDLELIIECCTDVIHFENGTIADQYQMDAEGMEKIRKYFMQGKCCGKWSKSD